MNVTFKITGLADFRAKLEGIQTAIKTQVPAILMRLALNAKTLVEERVVNTGKDIHGVRFEPYSKGYKTKKKERGGANYKKGLVNLHDTGEMMSMLLPSVQSPSEVMLTVHGGPAVYGLAHQLGTHGPKREWLGLTAKEHDFISKKFNSAFAQLLGSVE